MAGRLVIALHAHLPYVLGHGVWPHGEAWLYDAAVDSYLPLLDALERLEADGIRPRLTIEFSPVLGEQLDDARFKEGVIAHLAALRSAAERNRADARGIGDDGLAALAERWLARFQALEARFERCDRDLLGAFRRLDDRGAIELFTSARSHGFLPLLGTEARAEAQVKEGVAWFERRFGRAPRGFWMPECAYRPSGPWHAAAGMLPEDDRVGNEILLEAAGIRWTIIDAHLVTGGRPIGTYPVWSADENAGPSPHRAYLIGESGVAAFPRDPTTTVQVWSGDAGYPGNPWYLEFHRKHHQGGLRYWRVTNRDLDLGDKERYEPERAAVAAAEQGHHFAGLAKRTIAASIATGVDDPIVLAPYDAELFGHWWHEGVDWLESALRELSAAGVLVATASEALTAAASIGRLELPEGSWGDGGDFRVWDRTETADLWRSVYEAERLLEDAAGGGGSDFDLVLAQLRRTVVLIESSDWPFLVSTRSAGEYAAARVDVHLADARRLASVAASVGRGGGLSDADRAFVSELAARNGS